MLGQDRAECPGTCLRRLHFGHPPAPARRRSESAKIPPGCWLGKGVHAGTFASGPVKGRVSSGTIGLQLWVGKGGADAVGLLTTGGIGNGSLSLSGSKLKLTVVMKGRFDVTGSATKLVVNGKDRWNGKATGTGQFTSLPVSARAPRQGCTARDRRGPPSRITLRYGKARSSQTASRRSRTDRTALC